MLVAYVRARVCVDNATSVGTVFPACVVVRNAIRCYDKISSVNVADGRRHVELHQMRALLLVADTGSVTEAARRLRLTQPAVTRQIRALEQEVGGALFDRTTKPMAATPLGKVVVDHARRILQMSDDLQALVGSQAGIPKGELHLGVVHSLARQVIPPIVHALRRHYPEIQLRLTSSWSGALRREVEDGLLDAAIVLTLPRPHVPSGLEGIQLAPEPVRLIASTQTTLKGTVAPEDLRGSEWVLSREGCGYRALLKRTLEEAGIPLSVVVEVLDIDLQLQLIAEGVGLGIIAARALPPRLEAAGLQTFSLSDISFALETWLFHRRHGPLIPVAMPILTHTAATQLRSATAARQRHRAPRSS
jgi:DNA-binding transcriptional LysR family regulator